MAFVYNNASRLLSASYWTTATIKAVLVDSSYTPDRDDVFMSTIGASEISTSNYSRGFNSPARKTLSGITVSTDNVNNRSVFGANNPSWVTLGAGPVVGVKAVVLIEQKTTDADTPLLVYIDATSVSTTDGGTLSAGFTNGQVFIHTT